MSSPLKQTVKLRLAFNSCNRCASPGCRCLLTEDATEQDDGVIVGEAAHIRGEKPGAARHDPSYPADKVNSYENLIYLCPSCHTLIDKQGKSYTIDTILKWKTDHERAMRERTEEALPDVSFAELEVVTKALIDGVPSKGSDLNLTPPGKKIKKNDLSRKTKFLISVGLGKSREVRDFIHEISTIDTRFDERLVGGFRERYQSLTDDGLSGDPLFDAMLRFACNGKSEPVIQAAGLAVLAHLFETCDVFKK